MAYKATDTDNLGAAYNYYNPKTGAVGKYYFIWDRDGDNIKKITGVKSREEFQNNPQVQDEYFDWHSSHNLKSGIDKLKKSTNQEYTDAQLANLIHFKGATGARNFIEKEHPEIKNKSPKQESPAPPDAPASITVDDRNRWEKKEAAAFQRGIPEHRANDPELLMEFGIDPARLPDYKADILQKSKEQEVPGALRQVSVGFSSGYSYDDQNARQRYVHYLSQRGDAPVKDYGTDIDTFLENMDREKAVNDQEWIGFGDPTQDVNYHAPGWKSGFGGSPGLSSDATAVVVDPRFPSRDPITGIVTPVSPTIASE